MTSSSAQLGPYDEPDGLRDLTALRLAFFCDQDPRCFTTEVAYDPARKKQRALGAPHFDFATGALVVDLTHSAGSEKFVLAPVLGLGLLGVDVRLPEGFDPPFFFLDLAHGRVAPPLR